MMRFTGIRPSTAFAAAAMAFLAGCASDNALAPEMGPQVSALVVSNGTVVIGGTTAGAFVAANPNNTGRATGAFWDNKSADELSTVMRCNAGFFAVGTMTPGCDNEEGASFANKGGYTTYFGDGAGNRDATAFSFAAGFEYVVTLKGTYAGAMSEVGYYTVTGGVNTYIPVPAWSAKTVGVTVVINTGGKPWGFYIKNETLSPTGGCGGTAYYCSQAEGGFAPAAGQAAQQFALFGNAAGTGWLAGVEDNFLELLPNGFFRDSDYNDYMFGITARPLELPPVCDFMTFGRTQIVATNGDDVVISGNAGGNSPQGGILGNFLVKVGDAQYNLHDISAYGPIADGVFSGAAYPNARRIVGTTKEGVSVEIRIYDGGEPGRVDDAVYLNIGGSTPLGASGTDLDRGNIQYHANCRGPQG